MLSPARRHLVKSMFAVITSDQTQLRPGAVVQFPVTWNEYQTLATRRGDTSIPRIKYRSGEILLMSLLPEHGRSSSLVADVVKVILESFGQNYEAFTPVTIELPEVGGIEPDYCFYINNWEAIVGKKRIDWTTDPPPDLAIEIDVTNYTKIDDYLPYRIPEVWIVEGDRLQVYRWQPDEYLVQNHSQFFPNLDIALLVTECLCFASTQGSGAAIRE